MTTKNPEIGHSIDIGSCLEAAMLIILMKMRKDAAILLYGFSSGVTAYAN